MDYFLNKRKFTILFFNKTQEDIIWRDELEDLANKHAKKFEI